MENSMLVQMTLNSGINKEKLSKVKCEICGKEFEQITCFHLKTHGITSEEYRKQFPDAILVSEGWRKKQREVRLGKHLTEEHKQKIGKAILGKHHTEATKQLMRDNHPDNSGEKNPMYGRTGDKSSMFGKTGELAPMYGRTGKSHPMYGRTGELAPMYGRTGERAPMYGRHITGENHPNWQGGISNLPYCEKFDNDLKERVRDFFGRCCYVCGKNEADNGRKLDVHHVNYNKMVCCNDVKPLFVPLCRSCHAKTNKDREYWEEFFTVSLEYLTGGECFLPKKEVKKVVYKDDLVNKDDK